MAQAHVTPARTDGWRADAGLFAESADPIEIIKRRETYETLEEVSDRCEDVVSVIEDVWLKMG